MIPSFNSHGLLPAGIHIATIEEFEKRFAKTPHRKKLYEGLKNLINDLKMVGCTAVYVDGGYVTNSTLPKDIDVLWENKDVDLNVMEALLPVLLNPKLQDVINKKYSADVFPANCMEMNSKKYFIDFFQKCKKTGLPKGIIKIEIK